MIEKSVLLNVGPMTTFRPRLPKRATGVNTEVSNQRSTLPMILIGPVTSGRSVPATPLNVLLVVTMLTGLPLCDWTIAASCQPSTNRLPRNGNSYNRADDEAVTRVEIRKAATPVRGHSCSAPRLPAC